MGGRHFTLINGLNYHNPQVFIEMLDAMLYQPTKVSKSCAWMPSPSCGKKWARHAKSLPQAHALVASISCIDQIGCTCLLLLAEAILSPKDVVPYFGASAQRLAKECRIRRITTV